MRFSPRRSAPERAWTCSTRLSQKRGLRRAVQARSRACRKWSRKARPDCALQGTAVVAVAALRYQGRGACAPACDAAHRGWWRARRRLPFRSLDSGCGAAHALARLQRARSVTSTTAAHAAHTRCTAGRVRRAGTRPLFSLWPGPKSIGSWPAPRAPGARSPPHPAAWYNTSSRSSRAAWRARLGVWRGARAARRASNLGVKQSAVVLKYGVARTDYKL